MVWMSGEQDACQTDDGSLRTVVSGSYGPRGWRTAVVSAGICPVLYL